MQLKFGMGVSNDFDLYSATKFVKFDGNAFEPITYEDGTTYRKTSFNGDMQFKIYYVTKKDGTNWTTYDEMINANIEDMNVYESMDEIPEGYVCIGEYLESTTGALTRVTGDNNCVRIPIQVKETATIGQTYGFVQRSKYYKDYLDRDTYNILNSDAEYPTATWDSGNQKYIKTEYDENGKVVSGTHSGGGNYGTSVLIVAGDLTVQKTSVDDDGVEKVNYDISKNEYDIKYKITPILNKVSGVNVEVKNVTVTVTDTLPSGLTYVTGSCDFGEPEITENADGTTTLVWNIYDCEIGKEIEPIYYKAHINESTANGTQYTNTVVVSADRDKVGNAEESKRTATYTNQVINLASHRLYKTTDSQTIELGDTIKYTLTYKNNTDGIIPDFQLLDILPYNGDSRETKYTGTYKVKKVEVIRYDESNNVIEDDSVKLYYTESEDIRDGYSAKDDILNIGTWTETTSNATIEKYATAIALKGTATAQEKIEVNIYITTENGATGDVYANTATAQTNLNTEEITSTIVKTQVIKRILEGNVFLDNDYDSLISDGDEYLKDIEVTLVDENSAQVTDVYGNIVDSVKTDESGYYSFENLPKGNYKVLFTTNDTTLKAVEKSVGTNLTINSKINEDFSTDVITSLNSGASAQLVASYINAGLVKKPTQVITKYVDIDTKEEIYEKDTQDGRVDDAYTTVNELDNINEKYDDLYVYDSIDGNATGTMTVDTITVTYYYRKNKGNIIVTKTDKSDETKKIAGATFKVEKLDDNGNVDSSFTAQELTTDDTGIVKFEDLSLGKYRITETKAPTGYELLENTIDVELTSANNEISVTAKNRLKLELPQTGGINYTITVVTLGAVIMTISYVAIRKNKSKKIKEN